MITKFILQAAIFAIKLYRIVSLVVIIRIMLTGIIQAGINVFRGGLVSDN